MSRPAISLQHVKKNYHLGVSAGFGMRHNFAGQRTTMAEAAIARIRRGRQPKEKRPPFTALDDINLDVQDGEVLGLIGRNGAGKSTLLKLIARITDLSEGRIEIDGRVGSLLEVGTGFHPELTGKENVYLNGAILGMRKPEIDKQFDAIVDFSGVEQFLSTPVKRYSSGMQVRLAFAVAAHLQTEILLVDEVLSVGDKAFRDKCLGKLTSVSNSGRTVIYVSHLMETVLQLCTRAVMLEHGHLTMEGSVDDVANKYLAGLQIVADLRTEMDRRGGTGEFRLVHVAPEEDTYAIHEEKVIEFAAEPRDMEYDGRAYATFRLVNDREVVVAHCDARLVNNELTPALGHRGRLRIKTPWLPPGRYRVDALLYGVGHRVLDDAPAACFIEVNPRHPYPGSAGRNQPSEGPVFPDFSYETLGPDEHFLRAPDPS